MKLAGLTLLIAGTLAAQAPSPVQTAVMPPSPNGSEPIFRVEVTSRSISAVNYHNRQGMTKIDFRGTALMPAAIGDASVTANTGATRISLHFDRLSNPAQFGPEYLTYVLWAITPEGRAERLGEVTLKNPNDRTAGLYATTDLQTFGMIVTAEPYFSVSQPSDVVVMENFLRGDTAGTLETIDAKYELLKRGDYTLNIAPNNLAHFSTDLSIPLELREAREAVAIAKAQGAGHYAPDTMQKVALDLQNAEGFWAGHNQKELITEAREATQMAEDARRISIAKEREESDIARAAAEQQARDQAAAATAQSERDAQLRAQAETAAADAEAKKHAAEIAMAEARSAQAEALAEQQKLAGEKAAADVARRQAEAERTTALADAQQLRTKLRDQLNFVLQTRDTARGLIVNMSDVLFDFDKATLKPEAREKLAKLSGILLTYPTLHLSVEGHTDAIGADDYNFKLSQSRADSVRDYLASQGIALGNVNAIGLGKNDPVASNDTAAGRQQNRRVEMVVTGDVIGQPLDTPATSGLQ